MKSSLFVLIMLLSSASPSFAMIADPLDKDLVDGPGRTYKDLTAIGEDPRSKDDRYAGRSELYYASYPKMPIIHSYSHMNVLTPFSASLPKALVPQHLEKIHSQHLPHHQRIDSFVVQGIEKMEEEVLPHYSLKPQYIMHPHYPTFYDGHVNANVQPVQWMVVPGVEGQVEPELGTIYTHGLLSDGVCSHPAGLPLVKVEDIQNMEEKARVTQSMNDKGIREDANGCVNMDDINDVPNILRVNPDFMILSGDSMHLKGIHPDKSVDFTSLVAFNDQGQDIAAFTYHWLLKDTDLELFTYALDNAQTFRMLITHLEDIPSFNNLLGELKQYVGLSPRVEKIEANFQPTGIAVAIENLSHNKLRITTDNNANASYQMESARFPVKTGEKIRVPYEITVEEGGIMSLGLLSTSRTWWYGEELILKAGHYSGVYERFVPEGETVTSLVFRNYHLGTAGQTTFTIEDVKIEKEKVSTL